MKDDKECPMRMNKVSQEDWWCTREKCAWWVQGKCAIAQIATELNCNIKESK